MKITDIAIRLAVMPKEDKEWRFALGGEPLAKGFFVKLMTDEGLTGYGYAGEAAHHGVSDGAVQAALEKYGEILKGHDPFDTGKIFPLMDRSLPGNNEAQSGIDLALHDLQAKKLGLPLYALLGGAIRKEIPVMRILALKEPAQMAENALKLTAQGYSYIKVKFGGEPAKDVARIREVRKAVGDDIHLIVDMNQSYLAKSAIATLKRAEEYGVDICEQPVRADDWEGLAAVTRAVDCLVEAHESALSLESVFALVKGRVVDSINLKVGQIGGLRKAKIAAAICKLGNVALRTGETGSRLLAAASMHFVASTENIAYACELGEFSRILNDPAYGLEVENGVLTVPSAPGIGVPVREEAASS
jgi:L-alanine-DL-glutamate epimerase-like enolase superfamily enzyme